MAQISSQLPHRDTVRRRHSERQQLSEYVASHIREAIIVGEYPADSYIRTEHIAAGLEVSATPVREALMILQSEGTLRWEPRRGFKVVPITAQDIEDMFEVQAFIAGELAAKASQQISRETVAELRAMQGELEAAARRGDSPQVDSLNHRIHRAINLVPKAHRLTSLLNSTVQYVPLSYFDNIEGWTEASAHDHDPIFDALERGDARAAREAMSEHMRHIGSLLMAHLDKRGTLSAPE